MNQEILNRLSQLTHEEKELLSGHKSIDRSLYYAPEKGDKNTSVPIQNGL